MTNEFRKASDVLVSIEAKIDQLIALVRSHDLNMKVMSNKLNSLISEVNNITIVSSGSKGSATTDSGFSTHFSETFRNPDSIRVNPETSIAMTSEPVGFRRVSRPETYSLEQDKKDSSVIQSHMSQNIFNDLSEKVEPAKEEVFFKSYEEKKSEGKKIPVIQRVVDKSGKSIFLAEVEVINSETGDTEFKTRTNGVGKWQGSLQPGKYKVKINKRESLSKEKIELTQNVVIDGLSDKQELPAVIVK